MKTPDNSTVKYIYNKLQQLAELDNAIDYLAMLNCLANLIWEYENKRFTGSSFSREWTLGNLKVRISHENI